MQENFLLTIVVDFVTILIEDENIGEFVVNSSMKVNVSKQLHQEEQMAKKKATKKVAKKATKKAAKKTTKKATRKK